MVNVNKIFDTLTRLNATIILLDTHNGLCLEKLLNNPEFEI